MQTRVERSESLSNRRKGGVGWDGGVWVNRRPSGGQVRVPEPLILSAVQLTLFSNLLPASL